MSILVTGGAGFVGAALADQLIERFPSRKITILDALLYPMGERNLSERVRNHPHIRIVKGGVTDAGRLDELIEPGTVIVHMAVEMGRPGQFVETQIVGTKTVLDAALRKNAGHIVFQSTSDVYGPNDADDITEDAAVRPTHLYAATKLGAEALVMSYFHTHGLKMTILRPVSIYGPRQYPGWLIARFCNLAIRGAKLPVQGAGTAKRDWIHVDDIAASLIAAIERPATGEIINTGTGREWSVMQIARMILGLVGAGEERIDFGPARAGDFGRQITKAVKAERVLGWKARIAFEDGLKQTLEWYRANQQWVDVQLADRSDILGFRVKEE